MSSFFDLSVRDIWSAWQTVAVGVGALIAERFLGGGLSMHLIVDGLVFAGFATAYRFAGRPGDQA